MAIDTGSVQTFTNAELLTLYRSALAAVATGQSYSIGGRTLSRADLGQIRDTIDWLQSQIGDEATGGKHALIQFGEPR